MKRRDTTDLADTALCLALDGDWPAAARTVEAIYRNAGKTGLLIAMISWMETGLVCLPTAEQAPHLEIELIDEDGLPYPSIDHVPPHLRWAVRVLLAQRVRDWDTWRALVRAMPAGEDEAARHIMAVLSLAAANLLPAPGSARPRARRCGRRAGFDRATGPWTADPARRGDTWPYRLP